MDFQELALVERLISTIYSPSSGSKEIEQAQNDLQNIQKSPKGWLLAKDLLLSEDQNAQFLGAVTVNININAGRNDAPPTLRNDLLTVLQITARENRLLVARKLVSTLSILFFHTYTEWTSCIEDVQAALPQSPELVLLFCQTLVEDYTQLHTDSPQLRSTMEVLVPKVGLILASSLESNSEDLISGALEAYGPWNNSFFYLMCPLLPSVIQLLGSEDYDLLDASAGVLADIYSAHSKSWSKSTRDALFSALVARITPFSWDLSVPLGRLAIAICQDDFEASPELMGYIVQLTENPEPVEDDELANEVLEFWSSTVEEIVFGGMSHKYNPLMQQVIEIYWPRIQLHEMSSSSWDEFQTFRRDFGDFLESAYQLLGIDLFQKFVRTFIVNLNATGTGAHRDLGKFNWIEVEASLFCLNALADIIGSDDVTFATVKEVFASTIWEDLSHCGNLRVRQTAVGVIGSYSAFFESEDGRAYLHPALAYLFQSLVVMSLQLRASRSVERLCYTCRQYLTDQLGSFIQVYSSTRSSLTTPSHARVISGITYVIQALGASQEQAKASEEMLTLIETSGGPPLDILRCIAAMAKAIQVPDDPVDPAIEATACQFYSNDPRGVRIHLMQIINQFIDTTEVDVCETLCDIMKAGLREKVANPFVFDQGSVLSFIQTKNAKGPADCRPSVIQLASYFASTQNAAKRLDITLAQHLLSLVTPDAHSESLDMLANIISLRPEALQSYEHAQQVADFALNSMVAEDKFVLRSACEFWVKFISQPLLAPALETIGLKLTRSLAVLIAGEADRTDLSSCTEVIKKLLQQQQMLAEPLLKQAIVDDPASRALKRLDRKERATFVSQLILLRGSRRTNDLVKKFWLFARGIPDY